MVGKDRHTEAQMYCKYYPQDSQVEKDGPMEGGRSQTEAEEHHRETTQTELEKNEQRKKGRNT